MKLSLSSDGLALIQRYEGFSAKPYQCPAGVWTVGYGHAIRAGEDFSGGLSTEQAALLLADDVLNCEAAVSRLVCVPLLQGQYDALVSFTYNLGVGALQRSALRRKLNRGEYSVAAEEFSRWVWAGGRKLQGLVRRREAERRIFLGR